MTIPAHGSQPLTMLSLAYVVYDAVTGPLRHSHPSTSRRKPSVSDRP